MQIKVRLLNKRNMPCTTFFKELIIFFLYKLFAEYEEALKITFYKVTVFFQDLRLEIALVTSEVIHGLFLKKSIFIDFYPIIKNIFVRLKVLYDWTLVFKALVFKALFFINWVFEELVFP